jgi:hypothetical protein
VPPPDRGEFTVAGYLTLWEVDRTRIPVDPKERGTGWAGLMHLVRQHIEQRLMTSWGAFIGEECGYAVWEGSEVDVMNAMQQYVPFVSFQTHPLASEQQVNDMIRQLSG